LERVRELRSEGIEFIATPDKKEEDTAAAGSK